MNCVCIFQVTCASGTRRLMGLIGLSNSDIFIFIVLLLNTLSVVGLAYFYGRHMHYY